jgi:hypothetical protein
VTDAQLVAARGGHRHWLLVDVIDDDGTEQRRAHVFPEDVLAWRTAAEYGIDDPDELLEMVLYEP